MSAESGDVASCIVLFCCSGYYVIFRQAESVHCERGESNGVFLCHLLGFIIADQRSSGGWRLCGELFDLKRGVAMHGRW